MNKTTHTTLYRDKQNGKVLGVCAGIADYTGVNTFWTRLGFVLSLMTPLGGLTLPLYIILGLFLNKKPPHLYEDKREQKYWQGVRQNPRRTVREVRGRFRELDRRLAEVENFYVTGNPRLADEIENLR